MKKVILILCVLLSVGVVSSAVPDYLKTTPDTDVSPSPSARIGQPVAAKMTLERIGAIPAVAKLIVATELDSPKTEVTIDDETQEYGLKEFNITLSSEGVSEIKIRIDGYAPKVEKQKEIKVLDVTTHVEYKGEGPEDQSDGTITLVVSDKEIRETVITIEDAWDKYAVAKAKVGTLESSGVNTAELEAQLQNARELLDNADELHDKGEIDLAKSTAESASKILDGVILDVEKSGIGPVPMDIKRYLIIAGAVIVVLIVALFIKGKREELG
jgi:hypothetical protein